ncbi:MAG TPA: rhomboid family intramembrane serine protease [Steroidobacteraceae bacterium]|nr:rhomboid family intramembrane serine protease [Steroidobacteraceae bacterium]
MGEEEQEQPPGDGAIDFRGYSLKQLYDLRGLLDRHAFPQNFAKLLAEIALRESTVAPEAAPEASPESAPMDPAAAVTPPVGRFTRHDGWRGWLQALGRRSPVYGSGMIEITAEEVKLSGYRRTWLGIGTPAECVYSLEHVRNAAIDGAALRFEIKRRWRPARKVCFDPGGLVQAQEALARLPRRHSAGFEKRWRENRDFHERLRRLGQRHWITPALVIANILVFLATLIASKSYEPDPSRMLDWGANLGLMTTTGQWWRTVTAMFLHGGWLHLLLNMWVLWNVGRLVERVYGSVMFAFLYFATGICGSLTRIVWEPSIASVGASGAIFGVLGALLAVMLLHRSARIPRSIALAHWPSTLLFVLFNLINGWLEPFIDNAAHVGGLLSGLLLGAALVRPVDIAARHTFPARQVAAGALVCTLLGAAFFAHLRTAGGQVSVAERYMLDRAWYAREEAENLALWNQMVIGASTGSISEAYLADTFETQIVPFWKSATQRLEAASKDIAEAQRPLDRGLREYAGLRLAWAEMIVQQARDPDGEHLAEIYKLAADANKTLAAVSRFNMRAHFDQRPRALASSRPVVKLRNLFVESGKCAHQPPRPGWPSGFSDAPGDGPRMRYDAGCRAQRYFVTGDYQALEDLISDGGKRLADLRDGSSTLSGVFNGLDAYYDYGDSSFEVLMGRTSDWRRSLKEAIGAELAEVQLLRAWAWSARGHGYANSVSRQNWEIYGMRLEMAAAGLEEIRARATRSPLWYQLALQLGGDRQMSSQEMDELFEEAVKRFPDYLGIYTARMRMMMPRWGGTVGELDSFIQGAADSRRGTLDADERYAQLYAAYSGMEEDELNIFAAGNADWSRVQEGFVRLRQRYPRSDFILNLYAKMACVAGDAGTYAALRPYAAARASSQAWSSKRSIETCDAMFKK